MEEMNITQTRGDPGWPDRPAPERAHPGGRTVGLGSGSPSRWAIGLGCAVVLAGVSVLGVTLAGGGANSGGGGSRSASAVLTGNASQAGGSNQAGGSGKAAGAAAPRLAYRALAAASRGRLARLARLARHALHGQVTVATKKGPRTIAFERGTVQSVSGGSVVVKAADGVTWTWQLGAGTRVFRTGRPVGADALADGQRVAVVGQLTGGSDQARRILIRASS